MRQTGVYSLGCLLSIINICCAFTNNNAFLTSGISSHNIKQGKARQSNHFRMGTEEEVKKAPVAGKSLLKAKLVGSGASAPKNIMSNFDFETFMDTSDEWIFPRTGIRQRHLLSHEESLLDLEVEAAQQAIERSGVNVDDIGIVIVCSSTPDDMFGDASGVAKKLGIENAVAFDLTAACSGFLFGVVTASQFLSSGAYENALVVGADSLSRWTDWEDRNTCILFGDGAGAVVLSATDSTEDSGVLGFALHSDGTSREHLTIKYSGDEITLKNDAAHKVTSAKYDKLYMTGKEIYKFATTKVPEVIDEALDNAGLTAADVDWLLLHQANIRIMDTVAKKLKIPLDKIIQNLDEYGNTSAASIPLALEQAVREGKIKKGDIIACSGFGAGLSWGAAILKWG
mmetsp:Transcript_1327/g.1763  ORF Transcript_1327/g.1763 Transcript_1327/m.1763 type:complete len:399 (-) Transcript_1327:338-1534(-)